LKKYFGVAIILLFCLSASAVFGQRKLPAKAYLSSAKIDVIEGRPEEAITMLDSLFFNYGPHAEGLALMCQILIDYVSNASTAQAKSPYIEKLVAYSDSLHRYCENEEVDKKNRKECKKLIPDVDTAAVQFWREFYNKGLDQLSSLQDFSNELENAQDSQTIAYYSNAIDAKADSAILNLELAIKIDSTDHRPYLAIGSILEGEKKYDEAIGWFIKSLKYTDDSSTMLLSVAYNYINLEKYCDAILYFEEYNRLNPKDIPNANNLTICYIRCEQDDKARAMYKKMLSVDSVHGGALLGLGSFYRREASELVKQAQQLAMDKKEAEAKSRRDKGNKIFDTAAAYYEKYITTYPDSVSGYDEFGLINYLLGNYEKAIVAFKKLSELKPDDVDNWISLGDSYFSLNKFADAAPAYEKAVAITPDNKVIWERLSFLYHEIGKPDKKAVADKKLQGLN